MLLGKKRDTTLGCNTPIMRTFMMFAAVSLVELAAGANDLSPASPAALPSRGRSASRDHGLLRTCLLHDTARSPSPDPGDRGRYPSPMGRDSMWQFKLSVDEAAHAQSHEILSLRSSGIEMLRK